MKIIAKLIIANRKINNIAIESVENNNKIIMQNYHRIYNNSRIWIKY